MHDCHWTWEPVTATADKVRREHVSNCLTQHVQALPKAVAQGKVNGQVMLPAGFTEQASETEQVSIKGDTGHQGHVPPETPGEEQRENRYLFVGLH